MPGVTPTQMRLGPDTLAAIDGLAAGILTERGEIGNRTEAVREGVAYWHALVAQAARANADALTPDEWRQIAEVGDLAGLLYADGEAGRVRDWAKVVAGELADRPDGRRLAKKIGGWGVVRGYAMYAALRWFWCHQGTGNAWWHPEVWMTPEARWPKAKGV